MKRTKVTRAVGMFAGLVALSTTAVACGSEDGDAEAGDSPDKSITLGIIPSWTDGLSTAYLWKNVLEEEGYEVEIEEIPDAAVLYTGVAKGDIDVYPSAWPEVTHASYMEEYGEDLEDLGAYYDAAKLTLAVPAYTDIDSIADLTGAADRFGGRIVGIEPGAGLTKVTEESVMPGYGLDDYELVTSSTAAMLAELKSATDAEEDIVVTLWKPFWANSEFPVKELEDPEGALGEAETLNAVATAGFAEEHPEVAEMFGRFKLDDEAYGALENLVVNEFGSGKEEAAIEAWLEENPDFVDSLKG
ncbi:glycine/betaine ABC transporter substrate-binding protein [Nocardioides sp. dk4132]|uniref:glycine betaine ABC transporter substrate-binding protein n=1 Tax=unclassified Nocardioides TaxID=2615069 RepID=UPI001296E1FD|nr:MULTISPECIES: glycine betaine ABC transporter substrate-binding protein [unclassified Nocardioides]MQW76755.1 glycine/betaine ABC transporter substrate-binding protein [Nocardioides sp. dk4132]QGA06890.1 glycine/betaine ABC transporter substrate-binding protein [Nocardioides sp. dk884]